MVESEIPGPANEVAARIAQRSLAKREATYASEVQRLLDAALEVIRRSGTASRPRVADIVAAAGLSNDAFYRHFASKDALIAALIEDGTARLASYTSHQMGKEPTAEGKVRRWAAGVLSQLRGETASTALAVIWNAGGFGEGPASGRQAAIAPLAALLHEPFTELGSANPEMDASLVTHAVLGKISEFLRGGVAPTRAEVDHITVFCLRVVIPDRAAPSRRLPKD